VVCGPLSLLAGLGEERGECNIISDTTNRGDGITICNMTDREAYKARGYEVRAMLHCTSTEVLDPCCTSCQDACAIRVQLPAIVMAVIADSSRPAGHFVSACLCVVANHTVACVCRSELSSRCGAWTHWWLKTSRCAGGVQQACAPTLMRHVPT
jgi:hypothetical protein